MKYLLDTHVLIWAIFDDNKLPHSIRELINSPDNEIYCSVVSIWEITIKHQKSPDKIPITGNDLIKYCSISDIAFLPITPDHATTVGKLQRAINAAPHNDPFDRMLISQAKVDDMILLTHDSLLADYNEKCIKTF